MPAGFRQVGMTLATEEEIEWLMSQAAELNVTLSNFIRMQCGFLPLKRGGVPAPRGVVYMSDEDFARLQEATEQERPTRRKQAKMAPPDTASNKTAVNREGDI